MCTDEYFPSLQQALVFIIRILVHPWPKRLNPPASREAVAENEEDDLSHVTACFDGSWQKCGHTSLTDTVSATFFKKQEVLST
jgi:hypothetical protein